MNRILAIALVTFREAVRSRVLYGLLFFVVALLGVSSVLDQMTMGQNGRVALDFGLAGIHLFGVLLATALGITLFSRELARRTVYVTLAKPVGRGAFLLGKYLGLTGTLALLAALMGVSLGVVAILFGGRVGPAFVLAVGMIWVELAVLTAVALLFAAFTGPMLSGMFTLSVFVVGHLTHGLVALAADSGNAVLIAASRAVFYLMPNLEAFNFKAQALYQTPVSAGAVGLVLVYAMAYAGVLLCVTSVILIRRDFR